jgi:inositol polyphosphate-4-phosphatase
MQTVANATGSTSSQTEINERGVQHLKAYHRSFVEFIASASLTGGSKHPFSQSFADLPKLLSELEEMVEDEARHRGKDVEMLLTSCTIARLMNGARTTSCKSAKDRTSVFHSLEVARLAQRFGIVNP